MCILILHFFDSLRAYENYAQINQRREIQMDQTHSG